MLNEPIDSSNITTHEVLYQTPIEDLYRNRWNKTDDIILYQNFKQLLQYYRDQTSIYTLNSNSDSIFGEIFYEDLKKISNWRGSIAHLKRRLIKIENNREFTFREIRVLKKLLKLFNKDRVSLDYVHAHFPGKSLETIIDFNNSFMKK